MEGALERARRCVEILMAYPGLFRFDCGWENVEAGSNYDSQHSSALNASLFGRSLIAVRELRLFSNLEHLAQFQRICCSHIETI